MMRMRKRRKERKEERKERKGEDLARVCEATIQWIRMGACLLGLSKERKKKLKSVKKKKKRKKKKKPNPSSHRASLRQTQPRRACVRRWTSVCSLHTSPSVPCSGTHGGWGNAPAASSTPRQRTHTFNHSQDQKQGNLNVIVIPNGWILSQSSQSDWSCSKFTNDPKGKKLRCSPSKIAILSFNWYCGSWQ